MRVKKLLGLAGDADIAHTYLEEPRPTICGNELTWRRDLIIADKQAVRSIIGHESNSIQAVAHWWAAKGLVTYRTLSLREDVGWRAFDGRGIEEVDMGKNC